ncbi:MAG TPA: hypothetical protein VGA69_07500 [Nitriliruptorales bacterium]
MHLTEPDLWVHTFMADRLREAERGRATAAPAPRPSRPRRRWLGRLLVRLGDRAQTVGHWLAVGPRATADPACRATRSMAQPGASR